MNMILQAGLSPFNVRVTGTLDQLAESGLAVGGRTPGHDQYGARCADDWDVRARVVGVTFMDSAGQEVSQVTLVLSMAPAAVGAGNRARITSTIAEGMRRAFGGSCDERIVVPPTWREFQSIAGECAKRMIAQAVNSELKGDSAALVQCPNPACKAVRPKPPAKQVMCPPVLGGCGRTLRGWKTAPDGAVVGANFIAKAAKAGKRADAAFAKAMRRRGDRDKVRKAAEDKAAAIIAKLLEEHSRGYRAFY